MPLTQSQLQQFRDTGHLTVPGLFSSQQTEAAIEDAQQWGQETFEEMDEEQRAWYLERSEGVPLPRKLDNPVFHREVFRQLASDPGLVEMVEQIVGSGVKVFFSQIFFKPPERGGPKPVHQDNFYFGPDDEQAMLTAWIALDEARIENGCLFYSDGSHQQGKLHHVAPENEPFNLQIPAEVAEQYEMTPAAVSAGGVSFHHGLTLHQSSSNTSSRWRRAAAIHFLQNDASLTTPQLPYEERVLVRVS